MPPVRRFRHARVGRGGWTQRTDAHALDFDVAQNLRSSITWQDSVGGVVGEQLEWEVK